MKRNFVKDIFADKDAFGGKTVTVAGWARSVRSSNAFGFIALNDGSSKIIRRSQSRTSARRS